jgi:hypothetical protein
MLRRSRTREIEFMFRQVCLVILPPVSLAQTLGEWDEIAEGLAEPPRRRLRYAYS